MPKNIQTYISPFINYESIISFLGILWIIWSIFNNILTSLLIVISGMSIFIALTLLFRLIYKLFLRLVIRYRYSQFTVFDGIRALTKPLTPSIPITISLIGMTVFFIIFGLFSLSFQDKLRQDTAQSANIYAINVLEADKQKLEKILPETTLYSIIRARISSINNKTLSEHLNQENPSGELSREFNITTNNLNIPIIK